MRKHHMANMGRGYWLIGGVPDNEIIFYLPGVRTEETTTARYRVVNLTTVTPPHRRPDRRHLPVLLGSALGQPAETHPASF